VGNVVDQCIMMQEKIYPTYPEKEVKENSILFPREIILREIYLRVSLTWVLGSILQKIQLFCPFVFMGLYPLVYK
jgi:hypothetical protein